MAIGPREDGPMVDAWLAPDVWDGRFGGEDEGGAREEASAHVYCPLIFHENGGITMGVGRVVFRGRTGWGGRGWLRGGRNGVAPSPLRVSG